MLTAHSLRAASACAIFAAIPRGPRIALAPDTGAGGGGGASPEAELKALAVSLKAATDEVKTFGERAQTEMKNLGKVTEETKLAADKALTEMGGISARLTELEQKMVRRAGVGEALEAKSMGQRVAEDPEVKAAMAEGMRFKGRISVEVKNITSASTTGTSATTGLVVADRQPGVVLLPNRGLVVRDLLMPGRTNSSAIEYVKATVFTNAAGFVAENPAAPKPQSDISYSLVNTPVRQLAHFIMASKQILSDAPQLQSQIDGGLRYGLSYVEDLALLAGDGTGQNLLGLIPQASTYKAPTGVTVQNGTRIDVLRMAMLQATLALYPATGHVLNPIDWAQIELTKDTQNRYIFANPTGLAGPVMWGLPVVESLAMTVGNFLTGAFKMAAQIFDREDANVLISTEDRDNFVRNMVTILAEQRLALAVYRPQALISGTFPATGV